MTGSTRYVLILAGCVLITLPLEFVLGARVYRRPRRLAATLLPVIAVFLAWDLVATARGHWWFADGYVLGVRLLGLPIEEWLFFIVVPICALLTFEALGRPVTGRPAMGRPRRTRRPARAIKAGRRGR